MYRFWVWAGNDEWLRRQAMNQADNEWFTRQAMNCKQSLVHPVFKIK